MVRGEQSYNSFQIIRPVVETGELRRFLEAVDKIGRTVFSSGDFELMEDHTAETPESEPDETDREDRALRAVSVATHEMYSRNGLKLLLLDRRSPHPYKTQALMRARMRFDPARRSAAESRRRGRTVVVEPGLPEPELRHLALHHDIPDPERLTVSFNGIIPVNDPGNRAGYELALVPDPKEPESLLLHDEAAICFEAFAKLYRDLALPVSKTTCQISFARTPEQATDAQVCGFIEGIEERLPLRLELGGIAPKFND